MHFLMLHSHISHLILIALVWKAQSSYSATDVCNLNDATMFCNCDVYQERQKIHCFVFGAVIQTGKVWTAFTREQNTVELSIRSSPHSQLTFIPTSTLSKLPNLEKLTIYESKLGVIETETVAFLKKLTNLNLEKNEITALERHSISNLPMLKTLALQENLLTEIQSDTFVGLDQIQTLHLNANNITKIDSCAFCNIPSLNELQLWRNNIVEITRYTFRGLRNVTRLDLAHNHLMMLNEKVFEDMPELRTLNLKNNLIQSIDPEAFDGLKNLLTLQLNDNRLTYLPGTLFHNTPNLMTLSLEKNELETVQTELVEGLSKVFSEKFSFHFNENPLKCTCDLAWISSYIKKAKSSGFVRELREVKCRIEKSQEQEAYLADIKNCEFNGGNFQGSSFAP